MMKRLLSVAVGAMLAAAGGCLVAVRDAGADLVHVVRERWRAPFSKVDVRPATQTPHAPAPQPRVELVVSKSFLSSVAHRMRPTVTPWWRMCPSA